MGDHNGSRNPELPPLDLVFSLLDRHQGKKPVHPHRYPNANDMLPFCLGAVTCKAYLLANEDLHRRITDLVHHVHSFERFPICLSDSETGSMVR